jgi:hypothetical protein
MRCQGQGPEVGIVLTSGTTFSRWCSWCWPLLLLCSYKMLGQGPAVTIIPNTSIALSRWGL